MELPATASLRLLPRPALVIECEYDPTAWTPRPDATQAVVAGSILDLETEFTINEFTLGPKNLRSRNSLTISPTEVPCTVVRTGKPLSLVEFRVVNFPRFLGKPGRPSQGRVILGSACLQGPPWTIDIEAAPNLWDTMKTLESYGGYAITHTGTITRSDGGSFAIEEVEYLLNGLCLFLSFARGAFCGLTLVVGKDQQGELAWERWGVEKVTPWHTSQRWFDTHHGEILSEAFPGFWIAFQKPNHSYPWISDMYVNSNLGVNGVGMDGGLILTHAALERLSHEIVCDRLNGEKSGDWVARALRELNIPVAIPSTCQELNQVSNWEHGPHALTAIRNDVVHSDQKYDGISADTYYATWNLGLWYVELMLLRLFGYNGRYANRLNSARWEGHTEVVPWASQDETT